MNVVHLIGRIGKTPELRTTASGTTVCSFSLATSKRRKDQSGGSVEVTTWHNIVAFGRTGEVISQYLDRGSPIAITGEINNRSYENKEGEKKYVSEVIVNSFEFIGGGEKRETPASQTAPSKPAPQQEQPTGTFWDEQVPF